MHVAFAYYVPAAVGLNLLIEVIRVCAVIDECVGGFRLFVHLPEHLDGVRGRRHGVGVLIRYIRVVAVVVVLIGHTPTRVTEVASIRAGTDSGAVLVELEVTFGCVHEIGVTVEAVDGFGTGAGLHRRVAGEAVLDVRVRTVHRVAHCAGALFGVHKNAVGDMRVIQIRRIDTARVGAVVERAMVNKGSAGDSVQFITSIEIDETSGTVTAIEGTIGDKDVTQLIRHIGGIDRASGVSLCAETEETIINMDIVELVTGQHAQHIGGTLNGHSLERETRFDLHAATHLNHRLRSFDCLDG